MLILASASPRRREILERLRVPFRVVPSQADETMRDGEEAGAYALRVARAKVLEVAERCATDVEAWVLGADTVVEIDGEVLGKPVDVADAERMVQRLSGQWHRVLTAVVLLARGRGVVAERVVRSEVRFRSLSAHEVAAYAASGEGVDKAGAYAVQGLGAGLVAEIRGSFDNVVGLPSSDCVELLVAHGALPRWP